MKALKVLSVAALAALMCACGGSKDLTLSRTSLTINPGDKSDINVVGETEYATWTSADDFVAKVSSEPSITATIEAKHVGTSVVEATIGNKKGSLTVNVEPKNTVLSRTIDYSIIGKTLDEVQALFPNDTPDTIAPQFMRYLLKNGMEQYVYYYENNVVTQVTTYFLISYVSEVNAIDAAIQEYLEYYDASSNPSSYTYIYGNAYDEANADKKLIYGNTGQNAGNYTVFAMIYPYVPQTNIAPAHIKAVE